MPPVGVNELLSQLREQLAGLRAFSETQFTSVDHRFDALGKRIDRMELSNSTSHLDTAQRLDQLRVLVGEQGMVLRDHERRLSGNEGRAQAITEDLDSLSEVTGQHHARQEASLAVRQEAARELTDGKRFWITTTISLLSLLIGVAAGYLAH